MIKYQPICRMKQPFSRGAASAGWDLMWYSAGSAVCWQWKLFFSRLMHLCEAPQSLAGKSIKVLWSSGMLHQLLMMIPLKTNSLCLCGHHDSTFRWRLCRCLQTNGEQYTVQAHMCFGFVSAVGTVYSMSYCREESQVERDSMCFVVSCHLMTLSINVCPDVNTHGRISASQLDILCWAGCVWLSVTVWHVRVAALCKKL